MSEVLQYLAFVSIVAIALVAVFSLMNNSYSKYRHIYINNVEELSKHYYRYVQYFWGVGIFVPFSEFYIDLFGVRKESELRYSLVVGIFCLAVAFFSRYFEVIRKNLHLLFAVFFVIFNSLVLYKIAIFGQMDYLTLAEFTLVNMISYYVFYTFKYFYTYLLAIVSALMFLVYRKFISTKDFIIYFNSSFIAFIINYVIHYIDLSIKENLFFAYKFVNRGNLIIIGINTEGIVTFVSKNVEQILGYNDNEWIGKSWENDIIKTLGFEQNDESHAKKVKVKDGTYKFLDWHEEVFNNDLVLKVGRDVTEIKRTETQLTTTNNRLNSLLSNIGDLVFVLNLEYVFTEYYQNDNNEDLFIQPSSFLGKSINEIGFPDDALKAMKVGIEKTIANYKKSNVEYSLQLEVGQRWFNMLISPLADDTGNLTEIICIARNITDDKKAELELKRTKEVLEQTNRVARVGGWEYNLLEQKLYSSKITNEIFEIVDKSDADFNQVINYFDEEESREVLLNAINKCINEGVSYDLELAIITTKRKKHWVRAKGAAEFVDGVCLRIYGIVQDIDEQVKSKTALRKSEEKFRYISENISDVVIVFENGKVPYLSSAHERLFGYTTEEFIAISQRNIYEFFHPDDHEFLRNLYRNAIKSQTPKLTYFVRFLHKNGSYIWREDSVTLIYDSTGYLVTKLITARDISERKSQELENQHRQERVLLQHNILIRLSKTHLDEGDFWEDGLHTITEAAIEGIDVSRASFWIFEKNKIVCIDLYIKAEQTHSFGSEIYERDFPIYFESLKNEIAIVADDACNHKYTKEMAEIYLFPEKIVSMLDLPIYIGGELVGVICWEQTGIIKNWLEEDITFARSVADIISLRIEADKRIKAEKELKYTKELLEQTSFVAKVGGWEIDVQNQTVFFSDINKTTLEAPTSFSLELATALEFFKEGESRDKVLDVFTKCFKKGIPFDIEVQVVTMKGNERWVRALGQAEYNNGRCKRLYGTFQDIDDQVKLVQTIKDKELQYRTLISNISSVTFRCLNDANWTMIFISDAVEQLTGYPAEDFILNNKRSFAEIIHLEDRGFLNVNPNEINREYVIEYRIINKNNEIVWVNEKSRWYFDEVEKRFLLDGIISNITERKHAEIALVQSFEELKNTQTQLLAIQVEQEKFVNLVKYSGAYIGMSDMRGNLIFLNKKAKEISGLGDNYEGMIAKDCHSEAGKLLLDTTIVPQVLENGMWQGEHDLVNSKTKEIKYTDATTFIVKDPLSKKAIAFATIQIDISERKKAEAQLLENQRELVYKSEMLSAIAKTTEKLLVSKNIEETLSETFKLIGESIGTDRVHYFKNDLKTNLVSQKVEWVREGISSQLYNPDTQNVSLDDVYFYAETLLQNKIYRKILSEVSDPKIIERWKKQELLSVLLLPIFIKDKFYGFIGFDDCTNEQIWSEDKINILLSLTTNIANAIERIINEIIISESESNFRQLNETLEDVFLLFDVTNSRYIYVSPSCKKVLGPDQSYFYEKNSFVRDYLSEEDQNINDIIEEQIKTNNSSEVEYRIITAEGAERWIFQKSFGIRNDVGELVRISGICSDITERKVIQSEVKQLSLVAEKITNGVLIADTQGRVLWANQSFLDMMEIEIHNLIGNRPRDLFNFKDKKTKKQIDIINGCNFSIELEIQTFKKTKKWIEIINTGIKDNEGNFIQQIEVVIDISERKKAENLLKESEERFRFIAENTSDGIFVIENTLIVYTSPSFQKMFGYSFKESVEQSKGGLLSLLHPDDLPGFARIISNTVNTQGTTFTHEYRFLHKNGYYVWREDTVTIIYQEGKVFRFICIVRDITERKKSEERLRESERKLSSILNALDEVVWAISVPENKLLLVSKSFEKVYGKTSRQWKSDFNLWKEAIIEEDKPIAQKMEEDILFLGVAYGVYRIVDKHGNFKWLENAAKVVRNENDEPYMIMGIMTDITEKKIAEEALRAAQEVAEEANRARAELELRALQMQMNPHFVFNALNSIQSYVMNQDTLTANLYLSKFSRLIRLFLDSSRSKFISLAEEIKLLTLYIELEKIRFESKFEFEIIVDSMVNKYVEIPTMILQPFIENAINHGLRYKHQKGLLSIKFYKEVGYLICKIEDDGVGRNNAKKIQAKSSRGYKSQGLKITTERLMTYNKINDANIVFSIKDCIEKPDSPNDEVGTLIEIRFPEN